MDNNQNVEIIVPEIVEEDLEETLRNLKEEFKANKCLFQTEDNAVQLLAQLRNGDITGKELTEDQRRLCVYTLRKQGGTQDEIAALLGVGRMVIVQDVKWVEGKLAAELRELDTHKFGADLYTKFSACVEGALKEKKWKIASYALRDMVEVLQEMGIVYKAPTQQNVAAIIGHADVADTHKKYTEVLGDDKDKYKQILLGLLKLAN